MVGDYFWRQEKHINGESYILLFGRYRVSLMVDISLPPGFFDKYRVGMLIGVMLYPCYFDNCLGILSSRDIGYWNGVIVVVML